MSRKLSSLLLAMLVLAGAMSLKTAVAAQNNGAITMANGGAPVPPPPMMANGGAPVPPPPMMANGGAPVPPPPMMANGGAPVPPPPSAQ
jgi:hypothetical protein